jgi:hypothetical protein
MFFQNGNFYIKLNERYILRIPDEDSNNYHTLEEFEFIKKYIEFHIKKYDYFPILYMSMEGNFVLYNRILSNKGLEYFVSLKK